jgi:hypothetical protein
MQSPTLTKLENKMHHHGNNAVALERKINSTTITSTAFLPSQERKKTEREQAVLFNAGQSSRA